MKKEKKLHYLLGYFYADGSLRSKKYKYPTLETVESDCCVIKEIVDVAGITYSYRTRYRKNSKNKQAAINILSSSQYIDTFRQVMDDKINMNTAFSLIPQNLHYLFVRGFFDGDGCISLNKNGGSRLYFYGAYDQNWKPIIDILDKRTIKYNYQQIVRKNNTHKSSHIYITNKPGIDNLFQYMYPNMIFDFGLRRKYDKLLMSHNTIKREYHGNKHKPAPKIKIY